jgi:hypothetical protein
VSIALVSSDVVARESRFPDIDVESMTYELQQGYRIFRQLLVDSNKSFVGPFLHPVDATALGCSDYYQRIKQPICLKQSNFCSTVHLLFVEKPLMFIKYRQPLFCLS